MCDYSLQNVPHRLAVEGEPLQVHCFPSGSRGLVSVADLESADTASAQSRNWWQAIKDWFNLVPPSPPPAVCVPPGARLVLREIPSSLREKLGVSAEEEVTFVQLSPETQSYRDAIRFHNGRELLLQRLPVGQQLDVFDLGYDRAEEAPTSQTVERSALVSSSPV